jgi:hypothetical protein
MKIYIKKKKNMKTFLFLKKSETLRKKGHNKLYLDILTLPIISRQIQTNQCKQIFFLKLGKVIQFYYLNERSYQVSYGLSHNVNIKVFGIFMCLTQLQTSFYIIYGWPSQSHYGFHSFSVVDRFCLFI